MSTPPHPPATVLKVYREDLTGFSHIDCPEGLNKTLLPQGCALGTAPSVGTMGRAYIPRTGEGPRSLQLPWSSSWVNHQSCPPPAKTQDRKSRDVVSQASSAKWHHLGHIRWDRMISGHFQPASQPAFYTSLCNYCARCNVKDWRNRNQQSRSLLAF